MMLRIRRCAICGRRHAKWEMPITFASGETIMAQSPRWPRASPCRSCFETVVKGIGAKLKGGEQ